MIDPHVQLQPDSDRLKGWKDIASYLQSSVRTVQRWERALKMPVHRIEAQGNGVIFASRRELDEWLASAEGRSAVANRRPVGAEEHGEPGRGDLRSGDPLPAVGPNAGRRVWWGLGGAALVCAVAVAAWLQTAHNTAPAAISSAPPIVAGGAAAMKNAPALFLRLTPHGGRSSIVGLTPGALGMVGLPGGEPLGLMPSLVSGRLELRVYRVDGRTPEGQPRLTDLSRHWLGPEVPVQVELPFGRVTFEWVSNLGPLPSKPPRGK